MKRLLKGLMDLVFPRHCVGCGCACEGHENYLCARCFRTLRFMTEPRCRTCGLAFEGAVEAGSQRRCPGCVALEPLFDWGFSLLPFEDVGQRLVHTLKYKSGLFLKNDLRRLLGQTPKDFLKDTYLVPVPLHKKRQRARGFNQSHFLAEVLVQETQALAVVPLLERVRATQTQVGLRRDQRAENVKNAFALNCNVNWDKDGTYVLVDDVYTTGATLQACAQVLHQGGIRKLRVWTLAHG